MPFSLAQFAKDVAGHLPGWTYRTPQPDDGNYWQHLDGPDGASLSLHHDERGKKVEISPNYINKGGTRYPSDWKVEQVLGKGTPIPGSITVGEARPPDAVAKDAKRRLIDAYLPVYAVGVRQLADWTAYEAKKNAAAAEIAALLVDDTYKHGDETIGRYVYRPGHEGGEKQSEDTCHVEVRVNSPTSFRLQIDSLDVDTLKSILALFPKLPKGVRTL